ncbi:MAG TPA: TniB family NTP-binding protein [Pyrinomonadaceae bacterium]|jgi:hypothetical protein
MNTNGSRLDESAQEALAFSPEKRIEFVRKDRWIGYDLAIEIINRLEDLLTHPKTHRMPGMLIVSDTNNGKTTIVNRFQSKHRAYDNPEGDKSIVPVLIVQAPTVPDEGRFYDEILRKLGAPFRESDRASKKQFQVITLFQQLTILMLIIDEIQDILAGGSVRQRNFRNAIKHLSNEMRIPIVGVGTFEAFHALQTDPQLANRFKPAILPRWNISDGVKPEKDPYLKLLSSFERRLPLPEPSILAQPTIALKLRSMSEGLIGELAEVLRLATIKAIKEKKDRIDIELLDKLKWIPPSDRKWKHDTHVT